MDYSDLLCDCNGSVYGRGVLAGNFVSTQKVTKASCAMFISFVRFSTIGILQELRHRRGNVYEL